MNAFDVLTGVIARTFNRILVGAPTCTSCAYLAAKQAANLLDTQAAVFIIQKRANPSR